MESYYYIFEIFAYINSISLIFYCILSLYLLKFQKSSIFKFVSYYIIFSCVFDLITRFSIYIFGIEFLADYSSIFFKILYRLVELLLLGYLINTYWLKNKYIWLIIGGGSIYLIYDLITYRSGGILSYLSEAEIVSNLILICLIVMSLLKQLKSTEWFRINHQFLNLVFLAYFSIHLIYTVFQNFLINQRFSNKSFVLFYCTYALLHIIYYAALVLISYRESKNKYITR